MMLTKTAQTEATPAHDAIRQLTAAVSSLDGWAGLTIEKWYVSQGAYDFVVIVKIDQEAFIAGQPEGLENASLPQLAVVVAAAFGSVAGVTTETLGLFEVEDNGNGTSDFHTAAYSCTLQLGRDVNRRLER